MKGLNTLRIHLGEIENSVRPLIAASYSYESSEPQNLDGLERLLLEHLVDVEHALTHVQRMKIIRAA